MAGSVVREAPMLKKVFMVMAVFTAVLVAWPCYGQQVKAREEQQCQTSQTTETVEGRLIKTDWVGSSFTIRYYGESDFVEKKFSVSPDTKYSKDDDTDMGLADLEESDLLTVEYYKDSSGVLHATGVTVVTD